MATDRGICGLAFAAEIGAEAAMDDMRARWPKADFVEDPAALRPEVEAMFGQSGEARLHMIGAPFQIKVWEALISIPTGHVTTYSEIAGADRPPEGGARGGHGGGPQPGRLDHSLPPGAAQIGRARRLSLGPAGQARPARLGGGARRGR